MLLLISANQGSKSEKKKKRKFRSKTDFGGIGTERIFHAEFLVEIGGGNPRQKTLASKNSRVKNLPEFEYYFCHKNFLTREAFDARSIFSQIRDIKAIKLIKLFKIKIYYLIIIRHLVMTLY